MFSTFFFNEIDLFPKINNVFYNIRLCLFLYKLKIKCYFLFIRILYIIMKICDIYCIIDRRLTEKRIEQDMNYFKIQSIFCNVIYIRIFPVDLYKVNRNMSGYKIVFCIKCCSYRQLLRTYHVFPVLVFDYTRKRFLRENANVARVEV